MTDICTNINYRLYVPGGNTTALVVGLETSAAKRRIIQDKIMGMHREVEQVGFVSAAGDDPVLVMTGGEFCGNAARSAAWYYLGGRPGGLSMRVSGVGKAIRAGIDRAPDAWVEIPADGCVVKIVAEGVRRVEMEGITHLVVSVGASEKYLSALRGRQGAAALLRSAKALSDAYTGRAGANVAQGVIFAENIVRKNASRTELTAKDIAGVSASKTGVETNGKLSACFDYGVKIHPCVFVGSAGTAFYETACGSGSAAVAIAACVEHNKDVELRLIQPSGMTLEASAVISNGCVTYAKIKGPVIEIPMNHERKTTKA